MSNEEEKKDSIESSDTGEGPRYLSLDSARVLAMRTAEAEPGRYGRRYRNTLMAYGRLPTLEEENDDYYVITLSIRPQGNWMGVPGQEKFHVTKTGEIIYRQVLARPFVEGGQSNWSRSFQFAVGLATIAGTVVALLLLLRSDATTTPTAQIPPEVKSTTKSFAVLTTNSITRLEPQGSRVAVHVPAGAVDQPVTLWHQIVTASNVQPLPFGFEITGEMFDLQVTGVAVSNDSFVFSQPITVTVDYSSNNIDDTKTRRFVIFQNSGESWSQLNTNVDEVNKKVSARVQGLSIFALAVSEETPTPMPTQTVIPTFTPTLVLAPTHTLTPTIPPTPTPIPTITPTSTPSLSSPPRNKDRPY